MWRQTPPTHTASAAVSNSGFFHRQLLGWSGGKGPVFEPGCLASTGRITAPLQTLSGAAGGGGRGGAGSVWGEGASEGPPELKGGGAARSEMHSLPTALIRMEPFFLSLRHLRDGDLIEKKKGLYVGNPQRVKEFGPGKGEGSRHSEPAFSPELFNLHTSKLGRGRGLHLTPVHGGPFTENFLSPGYGVEVPQARSPCRVGICPRSPAGITGQTIGSSCR